MTDDQWKDKNGYYIWNMQITEGLFEKWDNNTCARLLDKWFDPTTEPDIKEYISTVCLTVFPIFIPFITMTPKVE